MRRAVDAYRGDLLSGSGYPWVEPVRQDLHRRALDAHLRLAELEDQAGHPDAAVAVLERVIDLDRYAEEPYRRLMALHAAHGRLDAVTATWQLLRRRLADLDVDMDETTARLYRTLTATDASSGRNHGRSGSRRETGLGASRPRSTPAASPPPVSWASASSAAMIWRFGWSPALPAYCYFGAVAAVVTMTDLGARRIPNDLVLPAYLVGPALLALGAGVSGAWWPLLRASIGMAMLAGFYLALALAFPSGMGLGDVKWAGIIGLFLAYLAWTTLSTGTLLAFVAAAVVVLARHALRRQVGRLTLPMAPFMTAGALAAVLATR